MKTCPQCGKEYDEQTKFCPTDGSTLRSAAGSGDDIIGSVIADRYHVLRKLGEGGMGHVYLAEHVKMGRMSAIKVMSPALVHDTDAVGRFNREAANASRISHPNVAAIYDFGETADGLIYLAMEFVEGESLTKLCEALGALPAPRAAEIARQVSGALEAAQERGIVHRDLKPDNIMISRGRGGADLVKVVDFGIAKAVEGAGQKVTRTGLVVGTPEYMSPEQLTGDTLDGRSDLYALALVTFNMLTGTLPFTGQTTQEALLKRLTDRPLSLAEARPDLRWPPALQTVLDRALARLASDRYQHPGEFGAAIVAAVSGMSADDVQPAPTQVMQGTAPGRAATTLAQPGAGGTSNTSAAAATPAAPTAANSGPIPAGTRTFREKYFMPAILAVWLLVIVGGAMLMRVRRARATHDTTVASTQKIDSAPSRLDTSAAPAPAPPPAVASTEADDSAKAPLAAPESLTASVPATTPAVAPPPPPAPAPAPPPAPVSKPSAPAATVGSSASRAAVRRTATTAIAPSRRPSASISTPPHIETTPPVAPPVAATQPPPAPASTAPTNAEQARAAVNSAGQMVDAGKPAQAMASLRGAMPLLPTRDDSVTALFYLAHAMIQRAATTSDAAAHQRGCAILTLIAKATSHPKAGEIRSLASQECK